MKKLIVLALALSLFSAASFAATPDFNTLSVQYASTSFHNNASNQSGEVLNGSWVLPNSNVYLFGQAQHVNATKFVASEGNDGVVGAGMFFPVGTNTALYAEAGFQVNNLFSKVYPNRYGEQVNGGLRTMVTPNLELRVGGQVVHANNNDGLRYENQYFGTAGASYSLSKSVALTADFTGNASQSQILGGVQWQF